MATGIALRPPTQLVAYSAAEVFEMAEQVARSGLFPGIRTAQEAFTLMMLCQAEGTHPMSAIKKYHIIEGRPAMRADYMLGEFQQRGGRVKWIQYDAVAASATFYHPYCPEGVTVTVTYAEMDAAGITRGREGIKTNWKRFPAAMLRARCASAGIRMVDPGGIAGIYTAEEVADFEPGQIGPDVVEPEPSAKKALASNGSGYGSGAYASPEQTEAYKAWIGEVGKEGIAAWLDAWTGKDGTVPPEAETALRGTPGGSWNGIDINRHLLQWAVRWGHLDPAIIPEEAKHRQSWSYVAILHARGGEMLDMLDNEIRHYRDEAFIRARAQLLKLRPDLAGDDGDDISMREPGDDSDA